MKKILLVEDDNDIAELERDYLEASGFAVDIVSDGDDGKRLALTGEYSLLLLDVMLPGADGFAICRDVRKTLDIPILMVSARLEDVDKIRALGLGVDDYIVKPFSPSELAAREFDLLLFLAEHPQIVFSKETLYDRVWDLDAMGNTSTVSVHMNRLREKIEDDPSHPRWLQTVWGAGYRFNSEATEEE